MPRELVGALRRNPLIIYYITGENIIRKSYKNEISISHYEECTTLLGPYNRFVIWVHGCCFSCAACLTDSIKNGFKETINVNELSDLIVKSNTEGITISGGEPFLQSKELSELIINIRKHKEIGVIVYSGYTLKEINENDEYKEFLSSIDVLIDGRYIKELDDGRAYVGSSNQVIHYLTDRYLEAGKIYYTAEKRKAEIKLTPDKAILIGVPSAGVLKAWKEIMQKAGTI